MRLWGRSRLRYDMFDLARSVEDARRAVKRQSLYHRGQELAWDGRRLGVYHLPERTGSMPD